MTVTFKTNFAAAKAQLEAIKNELDGKIEQSANQIKTVGTGYIWDLALKDTENLAGSYERCSTVEKLGPCIYKITWQSDVPYAPMQEYGPKSGKRVWRFRPHLRPGSARAISEAPSIIARNLKS